MVDALRPVTDLPLLVGVGIGTPVQASEACMFADGVIVGSALMAVLVASGGDALLRIAAAFRDACAGGATSAPAGNASGPP